jgi:hypothetical protein
MAWRRDAVAKELPSCLPLTRRQRFDWTGGLGAWQETGRCSSRFSFSSPRPAPRHRRLVRSIGGAIAVPASPPTCFGTYVTAGELIVYPFFEYYRDRDYEYEPAELGFGPPIEFRGRYRAGIMPVVNPNSLGLDSDASSDA